MKCATFGPIRTDETTTRTAADGRYQVQADAYWGLYFDLADHEPHRMSVPELTCGGARPIDIQLKLKGHIRALRQIGDASPSPATDEAVATWLDAIPVEGDGTIHIETIGPFYHELGRLRPFLLHYLAPESSANQASTPAKNDIRAMQLLAYWAEPEDAAIARRWWSAIGGDLAGRFDEQGWPVDARLVDGDPESVRFRQVTFEPDIPTAPTPLDAWSAWLNVMNRRLSPRCYGAGVDRILMETFEPPKERRRLQWHSPQRYWHVIIRRTADGWDIPFFIERSPDPSRFASYFYP
jgi:hypothetical protein